MAGSAHFEGVPYYLSLTPPYGGFLEHRKPQFKLAKTTFNAENFIQELSWSISGDFGAIRF